MKIRTILLSLCYLSVLSTFAQNKKFNQPLADSLAKWVKVDQIAASVPQGEYKNWTRERWDNFKDSVFNTHQRLLANIFKQYGYPGYDLVGKTGSNHFWLMVQHCDKHPDFQIQVLKAMKVEVDKNNADPKNFAYLTDRVNINTGKKQVYATQLTYNTKLCQAIPRPLADSANVNIRRRQVGLEPIEVYLNQMSRLHFEMNKEVYEKQGIHEPKIIPEPKADGKTS
ncbi:hypothetical protein CKK33_00640 [Mucilaginibacter sp. MD40]|uniref:DUF6624 domain-containing protein n=1 Tax=Mucilaginibacter sp. MD40 TaxID=2029590 RepID=UPI000BACE261|nr:DUF6624 domain-containing protein [Mucilaginibacter sp. MD40]PAW92079.1 hypothetical protein CKK33_00640 [Mucilaginibacter sp. MD40]